MILDTNTGDPTHRAAGTPFPRMVPTTGKMLGWCNGVGAPLHHHNLFFINGTARVVPPINAPYHVEKAAPSGVAFPYDTGINTDISTCHHTLRVPPCGGTLHAIYLNLALTCMAQS